MSIIGLIKADSGSLDYSSYPKSFPKSRAPLGEAGSIISEAKYLLVLSGEEGNSLHRSVISCIGILFPYSLRRTSKIRF